MLQFLTKNSQRTFAGLFLSASLLVTSSASALGVVDSCKAKPILDPRVQGRASQVTFPDGRELSVVGHHHGYRQVYEVYVMAAQGRLDKISDADFKIFLEGVQKSNSYQLPWNVSRWGRRSIIKQNLEKYKIDLTDFVDPLEGYNIGDTTVLTHAKEDYAFLKDVLEHKLPFKKIQFVGNEALDQERQLMAQQTSEALDALKKEFWKRAPRVELKFSQEQLTNLYISTMNGHNYLYLLHPELVKNIPNYGVESRSSINLYNQEQALTKVDKAWVKWEAADNLYWSTKAAEAKIAFKNQPAVLMAEAQMRYLRDDILMMIVNSKGKLHQKIQKIDLSLFPWLKAETKELFEAYELRLYVNHERDFDSVMNMVARQETGIHFVGLNHLSSRVQFLEELCTQEFEHSTQYPWIGTRTPSTILKSK